MPQMGIRFEDEILGTFQELENMSYQVAMEQMSKSGMVMAFAMRDAMTSMSSYSVTRVSKGGKAYLERSAPLPLGTRQSMQRDNDPTRPASMSNLINSFLMEKHGTLVVGGAHPGFRPVLRKDGKVVGKGRYVHGVSQKSVSILHRMDTGEENQYYDKSTQLGDVPPGGYGFMNKGKTAAMGKVRALLTEGFFRVYRQAEKKVKVKKVNYGT